MSTSRQRLPGKIVTISNGGLSVTFNIWGAPALISGQPAAAFRIVRTRR
jgi:hypothetical protein